MAVIGMGTLGGQNSYFLSPITFNDINRIDLTNASFDELYISKNTNLNIDSEKQWDYATILYAHFNGNLLGGNVNFTLDNIDTLRLKRRKVGTFNWVTLYQVPIRTTEDLNIIYYDILVAAKTEYEYALVPVKDGIENTYQSDTIIPIFEGLFVVGKDKIYHTIFNINQVGNLDTQRNFSSIKLEPYESKYPIIVYNSNINYASSSISATFVETNRADRTIDWENGWRFRDEFKDFLLDKKAKVIKFETGQAYLAAIVGDSVSDNSNGHRENVITTFNWNEIGNLESSTDLYDTGFINEDVEEN